MAENEEIFSSLPPWIVDWNILLFTKSVNHLDRKKELKKGATSSTKFGDQSTLRAVDFRLGERGQRGHPILFLSRGETKQFHLLQNRW
jgi:hypothetical protein